MKTSLLLALLPVALTACVNPFAKQEETGGGDTDDSPAAVDADGDGYDEDEDCDDADPAIHPGADEVCDPADVDEDCSGKADSADSGLTGGITAYHDADGDTYGDAAAAVLVCEVGGGYVLVGTDCDDTDPAINPAAVEVCDASDVDEDCDGLADDADSEPRGTTPFYVDADGDELGDGDALTVLACDDGATLAVEAGDCDDTDASVGLPRTWYADADDDGWGDAEGSVACEPGRDEVAGDGDCDDADAAINPDATEICDLQDNDCDGDVDDADASLDVATATTWYVDADGDGHASTSGATVSCEAPAGSVALADDCDDADATTFPGATEVCDDGVDNTCDSSWEECRHADTTLSTATAEAFFIGEDPSDFAGASVSLPGDLDGDGYADLVIGAPYADPSGVSQGGTAYVFYGPVTGTLDLSTADAALSGAETEERVGAGRSSGGDFDGDGVDELVVGSPYAGAGGAVYVYSTGPSRDGTLTSTASTTVSTTESDAVCGTLLDGRADLDGDGRDDLLLTCMFSDLSGTYSGAVWILPSVAGGSVTVTSGHLIEADAFSYAGWISTAGDVDADGATDILVAETGGVVRMLLGPFTADRSLSAADETLTGGESFWRVSDAGDTNADGYADVLVSETSFEPSSTADHYGRVFLYLGDATGLATATGDYYTLDGNPGSMYTSLSEGYSLAAAGDVDDDGFDDFLVGSSYPASGGFTYGAAYLVHGPVTGDADLEDSTRFRGTDTSDAVGTGVAGGQDVSGDGLPDVLLGDSFDGTGGTYAGGAWLLLGSTR